MKIAVYVEGQTELIFLCHFLRKWFDNDPTEVCIRYWELSGVRRIKHDLSFGDTNSKRIYTIINAGNDNKSLSEAIKRAPIQRNNGFDKVLVLRDMLSKSYDDNNKLIPHDIDPLLNKKFIDSAQKAIDDRGINGFVYCHFAIMELESWLLGMGWFLQKVDPILTQEYLKSSKLRLDLNKDPEISLYRPAKKLRKIYSHIGSLYRKREDEIISIMNLLEKLDFTALLLSGKCNSFSDFVYNLTNK